MKLENDEDLDTTLRESENKTKEEHSNDYKKRGFAKTLMYLWKYENNENQTMLRKIIEPWIRRLTQSNVSYAEALEANEDKRNEINKRNQVLVDNVKRRKSLYLTQQSKRARVPAAPTFDFAVRPRSKIEAGGDGGGHNEVGGGGANQRKNKKKTLQQKLREKSKSQKQAIQVSITGK